MIGCQDFYLHTETPPHGTTGASPAQRMFGRPMRSRFDLLRANIVARVVKKQEYQKQYHENEKTPIQFESGHKVYIKNFVDEVQGGYQKQYQDALGRYFMRFQLKRVLP